MNRIIRRHPSRPVFLRPLRETLGDRRTLATLHDMLVTAGALLLSLALAGDGAGGGSHLLPLILGFSAVAGFCYRLVGMNAGVWRYASLRDLMAIARAVTGAVVALLVAMAWLPSLQHLPASLPVILWFALMVMLAAPRILYRMLKDRRRSDLAGTGSAERMPALLVGTGMEAELFIRAMQADPTSAFRVVGILDEKGGRVGRSIHGVRVLGRVADLPAVMSRLSEASNQPRRLILTRQHGSMTGEMLATLVDQCSALNLIPARMPDLADLREARVDSPLSIRPIQLEDLLGRPQVALNREAIGSLVTGRRVLVTGAGGTIGSELARQIARLNPAHLTLLDQSEFALYSIDLEAREVAPELEINPVLCDIRNQKALERVFKAERPELVFHAAALKHVPMVEMNALEGVLTNVLGTRHVADAALACGAAALVLISSDKAVAPTSVMGATKRLAESYCQALDLYLSNHPAYRQRATRFMTVRFGNVLGSTGSVVPLFERQLRAGGPITVTDPRVCRYFMTVREAVELVLQASAYGMQDRCDDQPGGSGTACRGRIFVLDMGRPVRILDLARQMIRLAGLRPDKDIRIVFTGLRPGEKLYEEMFDPAEPPVHTDVPGVLVASPRSADLLILERALAELETAARAFDTTRVLALVQHLVPEWKPHGTLVPAPVGAVDQTAETRPDERAGGQ